MEPPRIENNFSPSFLCPISAFSARDSLTPRWAEHVKSGLLLRRPLSSDSQLQRLLRGMFPGQQCAEARWPLQRRHPCGSEVALAAPSSLRKRGSKRARLVRLLPDGPSRPQGRRKLAFSIGLTPIMLGKSDLFHFLVLTLASLACFARDLLLHSNLGELVMLCERSTSSSLQPLQQARTTEGAHLIFDPRLARSYVRRRRIYAHALRAR